MSEMGWLDEWLICTGMLLLAELGVGYFFERWVRLVTAM